MTLGRKVCLSFVYYFMLGLDLPQENTADADFRSPSSRLQKRNMGMLDKIDLFDDIRRMNARQVDGFEIYHLL